MRTLRIISRLLPFLAVLALVASCSDNPVTSNENHFKARGVILRLNGAEAIVSDSGIVSGSIVVRAGDTTGVISLQFIKEDGTRGLPDGADVNLSLKLRDTTFAAIHRHDTNEKWQFHLVGKTVGSTNLTVELLHVDHPDFTSPSLPIVVLQ